MCADCQRRAVTNPLRVFDCKVPEDQPIIETLPTISQFLDEACRTHYEEVKQILNAVQIPYVENPRLVRGLDYYTRTAFEFTHGGLGAQNAILGGGRYDGLSEALGGPPAPGIGFAIGEDRLVLSLTRIGGVGRPQARRLYCSARRRNESRSRPRGARTAAARSGGRSRRRVVSLEKIVRGRRQDGSAIHSHRRRERSGRPMPSRSSTWPPASKSQFRAANWHNGFKSDEEVERAIPPPRSGAIGKPARKCRVAEAKMSPAG